MGENANYRSLDIGTVCGIIYLHSFCLGHMSTMLSYTLLKWDRTCCPLNNRVWTTAKPQNRPDGAVTKAKSAIRPNVFATFSRVHNDWKLSGARSERVVCHNTVWLGIDYVCCFNLNHSGCLASFFSSRLPRRTANEWGCVQRPCARVNSKTFKCHWGC